MTTVFTNQTRYTKCKILISAVASGSFYFVTVYVWSPVRISVHNGWSPRLWNLVNNILSLTNGLKPATLCSLKTARWNLNMSELYIYYSYVFNIVQIEYLMCLCVCLLCKRKVSVVSDSLTLFQFHYISPNFCVCFSQNRLCKQAMRSPCKKIKGTVCIFYKKCD
jgi:hypothetical protein